VPNGEIRNDGSTDHNVGTNYTKESHIFFDVDGKGSSVEDNIYRPNYGTADIVLRYRDIAMSFLSQNFRDFSRIMSFVPEPCQRFHIQAILMSQNQLIMANFN
jgi:hypothetical protein